jgi:exosome complex component RRP4
MNDKEEKRQIIVPGETIVSGDEYLPGEGARREGEDIVASKYGIVDISEKLVRVVPLSGVYIPRRGNNVIGQVVDMNSAGWNVEFGSFVQGFLPISEVPFYVNRNELREHFDFDDMIFAKVSGTNGRSIDLSIKMRNLGKLDEGMVVRVNPHKVPRVIGKEGSMVNMIKDSTGCTISVGQNGFIWIKGEKIEDEVNTKKIIMYICKNSSVKGLTEKVKTYIEKDLKLKIKEENGN